MFNEVHSRRRLSPVVIAAGALISRVTRKLKSSNIPRSVVKGASLHIFDQLCMPFHQKFSLALQSEIVRGWLKEVLIKEQQRTAKLTVLISHCRCACVFFP